MNTFIRIALLISLLYSYKVEAQLLNTTSLFQPRINAYAEYENQFGKNNTSLNLDYTKGYLNFSVPVVTHSRLLADSGKMNAWSIRLTGLETLTFPRTELFFSDRVLIKTSPGIGFSYLYHGNNLLSLTTSLLLSEDQYTLTSSKESWVGSMLFTHLTPHKFSYTIGGGYSLAYGQRVLLPMIGGTILTGDKSKISFLLPLGAQYMHYINDKTEYRIFIHPSGSVNRTLNLDSISSLSNILLFKRKEYQTGLSFLKHVSTNYTWRISGGFAFNRAMALSNNDRNFKNATYNLGIQPAWFVNAGIVWTLPSVNRHKMSPHDEDPDQLLKLGIDIDDLFQ